MPGVRWIGFVTLSVATFFVALAAPAANAAPPTCSDGQTGTHQDTPVSVISDWCRDPEGDQLSYRIVSGPSHGTLSPDPQRPYARIYTPASGYTGTDSWTYKASDGTSESNVATYQVTTVRQGEPLPPTVGPPSTEAPTPPPPGSHPPQGSGPCSVKSNIRDNDAYFGIFKRGVRSLATQSIGTLTTRAAYSNFMTCPIGRVVGKVFAVDVASTRVLILSGDKSFHYCCLGRSSLHLKPTKRGRALLAKAKRLRVRAVLIEYDTIGGKISYATTLTLKR